VILQKIRMGERIDHYETTRLAKNGERLSVSLTISPVRDASGTIIGASKILRDISSRKRMEQSIIEAEKIAATGRMAAAIAHEINNPLESVVNLIYLAKAYANDAEKVQEYLKTAEDEIGRVSHIARQTLGFYREHTAPAKISLSHLISQTLKVYGPQCESAGIRITTSFAAVPEISGRRGELMQVVSNLIANAIHAMPKGGVLTLVVEGAVVDKKPMIVLRVGDNGVGIAKANLERVFEPFFTTRGSVGTGIGLWIAKKLVEEHGGTITLESSTEGPARGTRVSVFLPIPASS
jgi:signal transduction histidine kinase